MSAALGQGRRDGRCVMEGSIGEQVRWAVCPEAKSGA